MGSLGHGGRAPSGWEWNGAQLCQGAAELGLPGPALWEMQGEAARRAGNPSRKPEEMSSAVLEVAYRVLDLGVATMIGPQFQGLFVPVDDEAVIALSGEQGELGTGRRLHPPDIEPHQRGVRLGLERGVISVGDIGGAVHSVGNGSPGLLWYRLDQVPQAGVLTDGDGETDIHLPAGGYDSVGVEAAVGPQRELPSGPAVAYPPLAQTGHLSTSPVPAAVASSG